MKRSKTVNLVLLSVSLASCNRYVSPVKDCDWVYETDNCNKKLLCDPACYVLCDSVYSGDPVKMQSGNYIFKGSVKRNSHFVSRGGWGKIGKASS